MFLTNCKNKLSKIFSFRTDIMNLSKWETYLENRKYVNDLPFEDFLSIDTNDPNFLTTFYFTPLINDDYHIDYPVKSVSRVLSDMTNKLRDVNNNYTPQCVKIENTMKPNYEVSKESIEDEEQSQDYLDDYENSQNRYSSQSEISNDDGMIRCHFQNCNKSFTNTTSLKKHQNIHKMKTHSCQECGKAFVESSKLKRHLLVHNGKRDIKCSFEGCNKTFSLVHNMKTHLRIHTGEKPFLCPYPGCRKAFAQSTNLKSHKVTHQKQKKESLKSQNILLDSIDIIH